MSRNSYRGFTLALVLIAGLGMALPAAARPAERAHAVQEGLLERIWSWVGSLWFGDTQPDKAPRPTTAGSGGGCERGILIDPNGTPCHG
ncbi:MAG: hypothetical protein QOH06_2677 [Acidobacteriota bacterium]|jgi:hypothetical protein|nr:hypothetical protein [Acidobacteriota bacterium]